MSIDELPTNAALADEMRTRIKFLENEIVAKDAEIERLRQVAKMRGDTQDGLTKMLDEANVEIERLRAIIDVQKLGWQHDLARAEAALRDCRNWHGDCSCTMCIGIIEAYFAREKEPSGE